MVRLQGERIGKTLGSLFQLSLFEEQDPQIEVCPNVARVEHDGPGQRLSGSGPVAQPVPGQAGVQPEGRVVVADAYSLFEPLLGLPVFSPSVVKMAQIAVHFVVVGKDLQGPLQGRQTALLLATCQSRAAERAPRPGAVGLHPDSLAEQGVIIAPVAHPVDRDRGVQQYQQINPARTAAIPQQRRRAHGKAGSRQIEQALGHDRADRQQQIGHWPQRQQEPAQPESQPRRAAPADHQQTGQPRQPAPRQQRIGRPQRIGKGQSRPGVVGRKVHRQQQQTQIAEQNLRRVEQTQRRAQRHQRIVEPVDHRHSQPPEHPPADTQVE